MLSVVLLGHKYFSFYSEIYAFVDEIASGQELKNQPPKT